jgi:thiopeptide-type bacteriocin biosynthesis protein
MFEYRDIALIRAPALPGGLPGVPWPDLLGGGAEAVRQRQEWITRTWAMPDLAEAIEDASPDLAARLAGICAGLPATARQQQRAAVSLARYLLRMQHRATPFGLLAGVAPARITTDLAVGEDTGGQVLAGADSGWLAAVIRGLEAIPDLLARLAVRSDPTWIARDGRVLIPCRQHGGPDADVPPQEVSIRDSPAVRAVLARARAPVPVAVLVGDLNAEFPKAPAGAALNLVAGLVECGVLVSSLRAPMTVTDGLAHLNEQLGAACAESLPTVASTAAILRETADLLVKHATATAAERRQIRAVASQRMQELSPASTRPVMTDLRLGWTAELPQVVAREAAKAAEILTRLTANPDGTDPWRNYHARFLDRYGSGAVVRVIDLTDPCTGLGQPAGYRGAKPDTSRPCLTGRDELMLALAQQAALDHTPEVSLSRDQIAGLSLPGELTGPSHLDLCFQVHAPTTQAIRDGSFSLAVMSLTPVGGSMSGRFLRLLDAADRDRITAEFAALPTLDPAAVHVQVSSPPLLARAENVSRVPAMWPGVISLAEHPAGPAIALDDLAVTADKRNMYLISLPDGRRVEPVTLNAIEAAHFTHPMTRFLVELPRARIAVPGPFPWGPARPLPYLPRIRSGRVILAPATWRIDPSGLPALTQPWREWADALHLQRKRLAIPAAVYSGDGDQRLRLDLDEPAHVQLLHTSQRPGQPVILREAPGPEALGWLGGRAHEITLTLAATRPAPISASRHAPAAVHLTDPEYGRFPGTGQYAVAAFSGHTPMIAVRLPDLIETWDDQPAWWFTRPGPPEQLRLWLAGSEPDSFADTARKVAVWAQQLRRRGLLGQMRWETDYPCAARTGPATIVAAAENAFTTDSHAAVTQLAWTGAGGPSTQAVTVASLLDLAISFTGSIAAGLEWVTDNLIPGSQAPRPARTLRDETVRLACPTRDFAALASQPGSEALRTAWTARRAAVARYAAQLRAEDRQPPDAALLALVRDHQQRVSGPDPVCGQLTARLARSAALAVLAQSNAPA